MTGRKGLDLKSSQFRKRLSTFRQSGREHPPSLMFPGPGLGTGEQMNGCGQGLMELSSGHGPWDLSADVVCSHFQAEARPRGAPGNASAPGLSPVNRLGRLCKCSWAWVRWPWVCGFSSMGTIWGDVLLAFCSLTRVCSSEYTSCPQTSSCPHSPAQGIAQGSLL